MMEFDKSKTYKASALMKNSEGTATIGVYPEIRVEGPTDRDAIMAMREEAQGIIVGCDSMIGKCDNSGKYHPIGDKEQHESHSK